MRQSLDAIIHPAVKTYILEEIRKQRQAGCRCGRYDCKWLSSDRKLTETGSAKFFVKDNGDTLVQNRGILNDREIRKIQEFIKQNYQEMYLKWSEYSREGFYEKNIC